MVNKFLISSFATLIITTICSAQHSDILFTYEEDAILLRDGIEGHIDGFQIYQSNFPISGFSIRFTENPGYASELANGNMVLPGDEIEIEVLQSPTFGSYLTYYDEVEDAMVPTDATITITDNAGTNTADLEVGNLELMGPNPQFIQTADGLGEVHAHIDFALSEDAEFGAFGFLARVTTSNSMIEDSPPYWLVFNYGMSSADFADLAIPAFAGELILGDVNGDGAVNLLDVGPFVDLLGSGGYLPAADINGDGAVNLLDVGPFVDLIGGG